MTAVVPDEPAHGVRAGGRRDSVDRARAPEGPDASIELRRRIGRRGRTGSPPHGLLRPCFEGQKVAILLGLVALAAGFTVAPVITIVALNGAVVVFYIASNSMKVFLISRALNDPRAGPGARGDRPDSRRPASRLHHPAARLPRGCPTCSTGRRHSDPRLSRPPSRREAPLGGRRRRDSRCSRRDGPPWVLRRVGGARGGSDRQTKSVQPRPGQRPRRVPGDLRCRGPARKRTSSASRSWPSGKHRPRWSACKPSSTISTGHGTC